MRLVFRYLLFVGPVVVLIPMIWIASEGLPLWTRLRNCSFPAVMSLLWHRTQFGRSEQE
jgi:hypothetical protein